jgi:hypothetical protein
VGSNDLLAVPASDDPLACLLQQQDPSDMALHSPQALDYLDHWLMVTDDVRVLLAVLAPWLADQQPFLLVRLLEVAFDPGGSKFTRMPRFFPFCSWGIGTKGIRAALVTVTAARAS